MRLVAETGSWAGILRDTLLRPTETFSQIRDDNVQYLRSAWVVAGAVHVITFVSVFAVFLEDGYAFAWEDLALFMDPLKILAIHATYLWGVYLVGKYWHGNPYGRQVLPVMMFAQVLAIPAMTLFALCFMFDFPTPGLQLLCAGALFMVWWAILNIKAIRVLDPSHTNKRARTIFIIAAIPPLILLSWPTP